MLKSNADEGLLGDWIMRFSLCFDWQQLKVSNALVCFPAYPNRKGHKKMPGYICWHVQHGCLLLLQIRVQQVDVHVAKRSLCQEPWILSLKPSDCLWCSDEKPREDDDNDDDNEGRQRRRRQLCCFRAARANFAEPLCRKPSQNQKADTDSGFI